MPLLLPLNLVNILISHKPIASHVSHIVDLVIPIHNFVFFYLGIYQSDIESYVTSSASSAWKHLPPTQTSLTDHKGNNRIFILSLQMEQPPSISKGSPSPGEVKQPPRTPQTFLPFQTPGTRDRNRSLLYDRHELRALASHLGQAFSPFWRSSPSNGGGSTLYDSYEFRAVVKQLNGALHAAHKGSLPTSNPSCLDHLNMKKNKKLKQITGLEKGNKTNHASHEATRGRHLIPKIWRKLKRVLLRTKQHEAWNVPQGLPLMCKVELKRHICVLLYPGNLTVPSITKLLVMKEWWNWRISVHIKMTQPWVPHLNCVLLYSVLYLLRHDHTPF